MEPTTKQEVNPVTNFNQKKEMQMKTTTQIKTVTNLNQKKGNHVNIQHIVSSSLKGKGLQLGVIDSPHTEDVVYFPFLTLSKDGKTLPYKQISASTKGYLSPQEETPFSLTPEVVYRLLKARSTNKMEDIIPDLHDIYETIDKEAFHSDYAPSSLPSQMLVENVGKISFRKTDKECCATSIQDMFVVDNVEVF